MKIVLISTIPFTFIWLILLVFVPVMPTSEGSEPPLLSGDLELTIQSSHSSATIEDHVVYSLKIVNQYTAGAVNPLVVFDPPTNSKLLSFEWAPPHDQVGQCWIAYPMEHTCTLDGNLEPGEAATINITLQPETAGEDLTLTASVDAYSTTDITPTNNEAFLTMPVLSSSGTGGDTTAGVPATSGGCALVP